MGRKANQPMLFRASLFLSSPSLYHFFSLKVRMHRQCQLLRCSYDSSFPNRSIISAKHFSLLDKRYWDLSTPSRALPVLDILFHSGVVIDNLDKVAGESLSALAPCMTASERTVLQKVTTFLSGPRLSTAKALSEDEVVLRMYQCKRTGEETVQLEELIHNVTKSFVNKVTFPYIMILLELTSSCRFTPDIHLEILTRVETQFSAIESAPSFKIIWLLLYMVRMSGSLQNKRVRQQWVRLYRLGLRFIHKSLPVLSVEELMLSLLVLQDQPYESPFVVLAEIEQTLLSRPLVRYKGVNRSVLIDFTHLQVARRHTRLSLQVFYSLYTEGHISDLTSVEVLSVLSSLSHWHVTEVSQRQRLAVATARDWEMFHESLFAQIFMIAGEFSIRDIVFVLDFLEVINISNWSITSPSVLAEKLRKLFYVKIKKMIEEAPARFTSEEQLTSLMEALLHFEALLRRCIVLPHSTVDEGVVNHYIAVINKLLRPIKTINRN
ncbi:hypothetical protein STCU_09374 [Strigomonas culicis]|uniref:Uncharacterized protein n=1 Tax=Strigomonas culicis TaxID=28005 RepID=S9V9H9_9TRYP|nr:hypothetical protein STCU_09374 [Strigomonas culicis]|eukprot:EPY19600.1 hypothetical protein STCU_09374 [Strigomonas culicis]